ncbi:hypothetical protein C5L14_09110 [Labrys okinawensis]|uniref:Uncharacterized protein n=1 Tax=Labrys okinawensis TaxID=346911 RepID=A0A2S9QFH3_9HYPH|nr:hypothetical protein [Labrys okinawensis]PRH88040.1 hypothetical protein C5L14_09110 [Labrys okinawensis]
MAEAQENPAVIAAIAASYLRQGRALDWISRGLTLLGAGGILAAAYASAPLWVSVPVLLVLLFGLVQSYFALRAGFDAEIFGHLAGNAFSTTNFDGAMKRLGLFAQDRPSRPMSERARGAMILVRRQAIFLALQVLCLLALPLLGAVL